MKTVHCIFVFNEPSTVTVAVIVTATSCMRRGGVVRVACIWDRRECRAAVGERRTRRTPAALVYTSILQDYSLCVPATSAAEPLLAISAAAAVYGTDSPPPLATACKAISPHL